MFHVERLVNADRVLDNIILVFIIPVMNANETTATVVQVLKVVGAGIDGGLEVAREEWCLFSAGPFVGADFAAAVARFGASRVRVVEVSR